MMGKALRLRFFFPNPEPQSNQGGEHEKNPIQRWSAKEPTTTAYNSLRNEKRLKLS